MATVQNKDTFQDRGHIMLAGETGASRINGHRITDLLQRLMFDPARGRIWFDDRRMILLQAKFLGVLRSELIDTVGLELTKGLLARIGYLSGEDDGQMARKLSDSNTGVIEAIATGMQFHSIEGIVTVELVKLEISEEDEHFYGEFLWRDCAEEEMHTTTYGKSQEPTCWMQAGYASGYLSAFTGKSILAREVECRSMGFPVCRVVCKRADDWEVLAGEDHHCGTGHDNLRHSGSVRAGDSPPSGASADEGEGEVGGAPESPVGDSPAFRMVMRRIARAAPTRATVFLQGESGVGKSMFARELHRMGHPKSPFVELNCAAIPDQLLESELFGAEKGAFTGATESRKGRFEAADGGTIFLDEVGLLSPGSQGKLLRVLQTGELERLGSNKTVRVDVRVIAATNEDLTEAVRTRGFREDLYYRLNVIPIMVPPLRDRKDDIPILVRRFLQKFAEKHGRSIPGISTRALHALISYPWPGNIRELENVLERGVVLADAHCPIDIEHLFTLDSAFSESSLLGLNQFGRIVLNAGGAMPEGDATGALADNGSIASIAENAVVNQGLGLFEIEDAVVRATLKATDGNVSHAARLLKISRGQLDHRIKRLDGKQ
ncbi:MULTISPECIES: sigma-54-dependent Fis family transcriptional regulator [unclassified Sphingobium]|uniref:sigma-54-dependent Fis family transcriptional regulator n=2 Tax=Sphingobium TaxID=165695 RepID=UPI00159C8F8A|nr:MULTISPECIES: sigma-54-dependent Fis family transcriptional regulator [unclassified Sphingobium]CAH0357251.1 Phenol regulator MopR [Sphingobium sp. CECT 9361]